MSVTFDVSKSFNGWLKLVAQLNAQDKSVILILFQSVIQTILLGNQWYDVHELNHLAVHLIVIVYVHFDAFVYLQVWWSNVVLVTHLLTQLSPQSILVIFTFPWYGSIIVSPFFIQL